MHFFGLPLFVILLLLWFIFPSFLYVIFILFLSDSNALLLATVIFLLLPTIAQYLIVTQSLYPPWHQPGIEPKKRHGSHSGRRSTRAIDPSGAIEAAFEDALHHEDEDVEEDDDDVGTLGLLVGAAVEYYEGRTTNPLIDYKLPFKNVTIPCRDDWQLRHEYEERMKTAAASEKKRTNHKGHKDVDGARESLLSSSSTVSSRHPPHSHLHPPGRRIESYHLRGWYIPSARARTLVILVHGAGRDRRTFMRHAPIFHAGGYSTLLIDCREHGTSTTLGRGVGFTTREAIDVVQACRYGRAKLGYQHIVVCGTSQGASSSILATVLGDELIRVTSTGELISSNNNNNSNDSNGSGYLVDAVIAENPFISREACVGDVMSHVLGRIPRWAIPIQYLKDTFITSSIMLMRWRLGLMRGGIWDIRSLMREWQRAAMRTEGRSSSPQLDFLRPPSVVGSSPSAHIRPLTPIGAADSPLRSIALADFNAIDIVDRIAPRPLLLMHGLADEIVEPIHSQLLYAKARDPKKLWSDDSRDIGTQTKHELRRDLSA